MDTSETYIKMRLAAIPDLGMGIPIECPCNNIVNDIWVDCKGDWYYATEDKVVQLERQDQLQDMIGGLELGFIDFPKWLEYTYGLNYGDYPNGHLHIFTTWEQLWLAFVMKEKYNKTWNGSDWV